MNRNIKKYNDDNYVIANFFNKEDNLIYNFAVKWFYKICKIQAKDYKKFLLKNIIFGQINWS